MIAACGEDTASVTPKGLSSAGPASESTQTPVLGAIQSPTRQPAPTPTPASGPPPNPLAATAAILDNNSLIARIEGSVDRAGTVYVEYWSPEAGRFRSRSVTSRDVSYTLYAVRLRPNTRYRYQVFGAGGQGQTSAGPTGTFVTGALPDVLARAEFRVLTGKPTFDLTYLEFRQPGFSGLAAIDGAGHVVWYYEPPQKNHHPYTMAQKPNGNIVFLANHELATSHGLVEITPLGEEVDRLVAPCAPDGPIHHEVRLMPDGRIMYMSKFVVRRGIGDRPAPQESDTIGIWDQSTGENEIVWYLGDFVPLSSRTFPSSVLTRKFIPLWAGCGRDVTVQDWSHGNSTYVADDGSTLASFRHLDQIISIAPDFKSLRWRLGGPGSDFTFPDPTDRFYHQHTAVQLANGNVLLFDNGNFRPIKEGGLYSRALELQLDMETMTARKVWEYRHDPDLFANCCSGVTRMPNGNTLLVFAMTPANVCCRPFHIVEVSPQSEVVWEMVHYSPGKVRQYRVHPSNSIMGETRALDQVAAGNAP